MRKQTTLRDDPNGFRVILHRSTFFLCCALATGASAQPYPVEARPHHRRESPRAAASDFVARFVAQRLTELLGQQVVVENRAGGGGTIGYEYGVKSAPDGYTLTIITATYTINPGLYPIKFDPLHDFTPIVRVARGPYVIVVHPSLPARNVKELVALAKARPGQITYGTSGTGAIVHLTTELFLYKAGIKMTHVPYKGGSLALVDLMAGNIQLVFATSQTGLAQAKAGRVRALAVTTPERVAAAPGPAHGQGVGRSRLRSHQLARADRAQGPAAPGGRAVERRHEQAAEVEGCRGASQDRRRIARGRHARAVLRGDPQGARPMAAGGGAGGGEDQLKDA